MRRIIAILLTGSTIFLSSCTPASPVLVLPTLDIPTRPAMLPVEWQHENGSHCLNDDNAKNLLINIERLQSHIEVLEGYLQAVKE